MKQLADGVHVLRGFPPNAINAYLADGVLIDARTRLTTREILKELRGQRVEAHALTHAHPDHQGSSHAVCEELGIPYWVGDADADAAESGELLSRLPDTRLARMSNRAFSGPGHPVARRLREGDEVGGFTVLETPGHSPGHVAFWRASDRTLILGDVLFNQHPVLGIPGLREPPAFFTPDPARNRESVRRLAALEPALVLFGHGPPLRDAAKLRAFADSLP